MEGAPTSIDPSKIAESLTRIEGVLDIHSLHIWTITSGVYSFTCHLLIEPGGDSQTVLDEASAIVRKDYSFHFSTIQIEAKSVAACKG